MSVFRALPFPMLTSVNPFITRIEPNPVSGDPARGLQAQVWDPLFLLGRQHQLGELTGEDTGTPLAVEVTASFDPLVAWHAGPFPVDAEPEWRPLSRGQLLEPLVEAERAGAAGEGDAAVSTSGFGARFDASAAWALHDALGALGETAALRELIAHCPARPVAIDPDAAGSGWAGVMDVLTPRAMDAAAVVDAFAGGVHPEWFTSALRPGTARRRRAVEAVDEWLAWMVDEGAGAGASAPESWRGERLEYEFAIATTNEVLHAPAYGGGSIGWASVDLDPHTPPPSDGGAPSTILSRRVLASQLSFPGMPASRFWEFEDADIDLGAVWADPDELARVLVVEAAIVTGDDWLVLPFDAPPGGVLRVTGVRWLDTFGGEWSAPERPAAVPAGRPAAPWRAFTTSEAARPGDLGWTAQLRGARGWEEGIRRELAGLFVPPATASSIEGPVVEDVRFLRDETANLVWALEQIAASASGDPMPIIGGTAPAPAPIDPGDQPADEVLGYALQTFVPGNWHPYVARWGEDGVVLDRARVDRGDAADETGSGAAQGVLLTEDAQRVILAGEVPRQGVRVQRLARVARDADGRWSMWLSRRVTPGHGEGESGLAYDRTRRPG